MSSSASVPLPPERRKRRFSVHLLSGTQEPVARAFARQAPLPDKLLPSDTPNTPKQAGATNDEFPAELFEQLKAGRLGALHCEVVSSTALWEMGDRNKPRDGAEEEVRSQLFIARVEEVEVGEGADGAGSLVYGGQAYATVVTEEGKP